MASARVFMCMYRCTLYIVEFAKLLCLYRKFVRSQVIFANTLFKAVCYRMDESQIITGGTDRKVS